MIYACEHHDEVLHLWRRENRRDVRLAHVDFHDDLRGLLVDRRRGRAYPIGALARKAAPLDGGNFLAHAVLEGRLRDVRWIHDVPGGRAWDAGIVRYESDWFAWPARRRQRLRPNKEYALDFEELLLEGWDGLRPEERLSVDWDCFASTQLEAAGIPARVERFLDRLGSRVPEDTYVAFSPEYSHPGLDAFRGLLDTLARRFDQPITWLSPDLARGRTTPRPVDPDPGRRPLMRAILFLRRRGIF